MDESFNVFVPGEARGTSRNGRIRDDESQRPDGEHLPRGKVLLQHPFGSVVPASRLFGLKHLNAQVLMDSNKHNF